MAHQAHTKLQIFPIISTKCIICLIFCLNLILPQFALASKPQPQLPLEPIEIHASTGLALKTNSLKFCVEIADEPKEQSIGLMHRTSLRTDTGMLFLFDQPEIHEMWMKNTPISLDMIFIDKSGQIIHIEQNTSPFSLTPIGPKQPVTAVLELVAGSSQKLGIKQGSFIHHRAFGQNLPDKCSG